MVSASDGSAVTSGTPTVYVTLDGTQATGTGTATHKGFGLWDYIPTQAETNGNHVAYTMVLATAISQTVEAWPLATDLQTTATPTVNATAVGGTAQTPGDLMAYLASVRTTVEALPSAAAIAVAVWAAGTRTLTGFGTLVADIWSYVTRTLTSGGDVVLSVTVPRSVVADSQDPDVITAVRAATLRRTLPPVGSLVGIEELWLTVKRSLEDSDNDALIQTKLTVGLVRLNGAAATAADGSLEITDYDAGNVNWLVKAAAVAQLPLIQGAHFDLKGRFSSSGDVVVLIDDGTFNLTSEVTDAT